MSKVHNLVEPPVCSPAVAWLAVQLSPAEHMRITILKPEVRHLPFFCTLAAAGSNSSALARCDPTIYKCACSGSIWGAHLCSANGSDDQCRPGRIWPNLDMLRVLRSKGCTWAKR